MLGALHELCIDPVRRSVRRPLVVHPPDVLACPTSGVNTEGAHHREDLLAAGGDLLGEVVAVDHVLGSAVDGAGTGATAVRGGLGDRGQSPVFRQRCHAVAGAVLVGVGEEVGVGSAVGGGRLSLEMAPGEEGDAEHRAGDDHEAGNPAPPGRRVARSVAAGLDGRSRSAQRLPLRLGGGHARAALAHGGITPHRRQATRACHASVASPLQSDRVPVRGRGDDAASDAGCRLLTRSLHSADSRPQIGV